MPSPASAFADRYVRSFTVGLVAVVAIWHGGYDLVLLLAHLSAYRPRAWEVVAWAAMLVIVVLAARAAVSDRHRRRDTWPLAAATLAAGAVATFACPPDAFLESDWAFGGMGWVAVLILFRRPVAEFVAMAIAVGVITFAGLVIVGHTDRVTVSRFATVLYAATSVQLVVVWAARAIDSTAARAATDAAFEAATLDKRRAAEEVHAARLRRYSTVQASAGPWLTGLADGSLDPGDPAVRRQCAIEAARLRRLLAESDDVPDRLLHELRACAEIAERKGVIVDFDVVGTTQPVPDTVRRALVDTPLAVLATAASRARVTVTARPRDVAVSVMADTDQAPNPHPEPGVGVAVQREGDETWVEARWTGR